MARLLSDCPFPLNLARGNFFPSFQAKVHFYPAPGSDLSLGRLWYYLLLLRVFYLCPHLCSFFLIQPQAISKTSGHYYWTAVHFPKFGYSSHNKHWKIKSGTFFILSSVFRFSIPGSNCSIQHWKIPFRCKRILNSYISLSNRTFQT